MATRSTFQLSVGTLVGQTLTVYFRNLLPFLVLSAVVLSPWIALRLYLDTRPLDPSSPGASGIVLVATVLQMLLTQVLTGAVTYGVVQQLRGETAGIGAVVSQGLRTFVTVLGTGILCGLRIMLFMLLLIVPGIMESIRLYVAIPAAVMEGRGAAHAIQRSNTLTEGSRWQIFGAWLLIFLLPFTLTFVLLFVMRTSIRDIDQLPAWAEIAMALLLNAFGSTMMAVCYFQLRTGKENVDVKELAAVFA
jgi:uncharacterized membrane protein